MKLPSKFVLFLSFFVVACKKEKSPNLLLLAGLIPKPYVYEWNLPPGFPTPRVPVNNPITREKVELGRFLFYEKKLSGNNTMSCASCHLQELAFADGKVNPFGITGEFHARNAQALVNVAYNSRQTWVNILFVDLEQQAHGPLFGESPVELGLFITEPEIREKLKQDSIYLEMFKKAFPDSPEPITITNIIRAISSFQRTLISGNSPHDKYIYQGQKDAMSASAKRGFQFFNSEVAECFHCHDGVNFNDSTFHENTSAVIEPLYHNNGLYNIPVTGNPPNNLGLMEVTGNPNHRGGFKTPTLRNLLYTYPYMHDGSMSCDDDKNPLHPLGKANGATNETCARQALGRVLDHYARGGNHSTCVAYSTPGGTKNPSYPCLSNTPQANVDTTLIRAFPMSAQEREDLINFLLSLSDEEFTKDPRFSNPRP